jgi:hypothetical protein
MLKLELKLRRGTRALGKHALEVSDGLKQRIGACALGRFLLAAKPSPQSVQTAAQFSAQLIEGLQGKRQTQLFRRGFEREPGYPLDQPSPQPVGPESVARQNIGQEDAEAATTAATLATAAAPHPLPAKTIALSGQRIVAVKLTVVV